MIVAHQHMPRYPVEIDRGIVLEVKKTETRAIIEENSGEGEM